MDTLLLVPPTRLAGLISDGREAHGFGKGCGGGNAPDVYNFMHEVFSPAAALQQLWHSTYQSVHRPVGLYGARNEKKDELNTRTTNTDTRTHSPSERVDRVAFL